MDEQSQAEDRDIALRRIQVEKTRMTNNDKRALEVAEERKMHLSIHSKMLDFWTAQIHKRNADS